MRTIPSPDQLLVPAQSSPNTAGPSHGLAVASLTFGILGAIGYPLAGMGLSGPVVAVAMLLFPVVAIVTGAMANSRSKRATGQGEGMATAGITLGIVELLLVMVGILLIISLFSAWDDSLRMVSVVRGHRAS